MCPGVCQHRECAEAFTEQAAPASLSLASGQPLSPSVSLSSLISMGRASAPAQPLICAARPPSWPSRGFFHESPHSDRNFSEL